MVAIHRIITAAKSGDANSVETGKVPVEIFQIRRRGLGRRVSPVEEGVDGDRHPGLDKDPGEGGDLVLVRVHAARRQQPHQVSGSAAPVQLADKVAQCRHGGELPAGDCGVDARQILEDQPSGTEIGVADLGIAHLAIGEPDIVLARLQMRMRPARHQPMPHRSAGGRDRIVVGIRPLAPAVEDAEHQRVGSRTGDHWTTSNVRVIYISETGALEVAFPADLAPWHATFSNARQPIIRRRGTQCHLPQQLVVSMINRPAILANLPQDFPLRLKDPLGSVGRDCPTGPASWSRGGLVSRRAIGKKLAL